MNTKHAWRQNKRNAQKQARKQAAAITRKQAAKTALKALNVKTGKFDVIVFGLPRPLGARQAVPLASARNLGIARATKTQRRKLPKLGARTWLFWAHASAISSIAWAVTSTLGASITAPKSQNGML